MITNLCKKYSLICLSLTLIPLFAFLYFYELTPNFFPDTDFTRDAYHIIGITQGKLTLIGPSLRIGIYSGPYYLYLFAPALLISNFNITSILYFNAFLFVSGLVAILFILNNKYGLHTALVTAISAGLLPGYIISARHPGNAFSFLPLLLMYFLACLIFKASTRNLFLLGLFSGILFNFHPTSLLATLPPLFLFLHKTHFSLKYIFLFVLGFTLTFAPLVLFEIRHNFVLLKGLISSQTYSGSLAIYSKSPYYLYSFLLMLIFYISIAISRSKRKYLNLLLIICLILFFPTKIFQPSPVNILDSEARVRYVISSHILDPNKSFNLISVTDPKMMVPMGHDYRYAFYKYGFRPLEENDYASAQQLLIFSTNGTLDLLRFQNWATDQFGQKLVSSASAYFGPGVVIYLANK